MLPRLFLTITTLCALDNQRTNEAQFIVTEREQRVEEFMRTIPRDLHTGVAEYMEKKRAWEVVIFKNIENILSNRKSPTATVGTTQLPANESTFSELAIG